VRPVLRHAKTLRIKTMKSPIYIIAYGLWDAMGPSP
jgi:hypothetical protein